MRESRWTRLPNFEKLKLNFVEIRLSNFLVDSEKLLLEIGPMVPNSINLQLIEFVECDKLAWVQRGSFVSCHICSIEDIL